MKPKKFYVEDRMQDYFWGKSEDATVDIDFIMVLDNLIERSRRGLPWKCLLANGTMKAAQDNPGLFPFKVKWAYVEGSYIWVFSSIPRRGRGIPMSHCWRHNFTKTLRQYDTLTRPQFIALFGTGGVEIRLRPPVRRPHDDDRDHGRPQRSRHPTEREAGERRYVGAKKRAVDAGLLDRVEINGERPTV